jgi:hypothetical protein
MDTTDSINIKRQEIELKLSNDDYYDFIRNEVQVKSESLIQSIELQAEELLAKINQYQQLNTTSTRLIFRRNKNELTNDLIGTLNDIDGSLAKKFTFLDSSKVENKFDLNKILSNYDAINNQFNSNLFSIEKNNNFIITWSTKSTLSRNVLIGLFDSNFNLIKTLLINHEIQSINAIKKFNNLIIMNASTDNDSNYLIIINQDLNVVKILNIGRVYSSICADSTTISCFCQKLLYIDHFDWNLNSLKRSNFQNEQTNSPFFIESKINKTQIDIISKNKYILSCSNSLRIIDIINGKEDISIDINCKQCLVNNGTIIVLLKNNDSIQAYDCNGQLLKEYTFDHQSNDSILIETNHNNSYLIFDKKNQFLYSF